MKKRLTVENQQEKGRGTKKRNGGRVTKYQQATQMILKKILTDTTHVLLAEDSKDIIKLNDLAYKVAQPSDVNEWNILERPLKVGNVTLNPATPATLLWLKDSAAEWFADEADLQELSVPFALAHEAAYLNEINGAADARKKIKKWIRGVKCSINLLARALEILLPVAGEDSVEDDANNFGPVVAFLCREYGENPNYWLTEASLGMIQTLIADFNQRMLRDFKEAARQANNTKGAKSPPTPELKLKAVVALKQFEEELREKWQT